MTLPCTQPSSNSACLLAHPTSPTALAIYVVLVSVLIDLTVLGWLGIRHGADTTRYLDGAANLLAGRPFQEKQASYIGYIAAVAISAFLGVGTAGVVGLQIAVAALAALALYDLGRQLSGRLAGLLASGALILNVEIAWWHTYVLTDSLYISLVVLSTWFIHRAVDRGRWWYGAAAVLVFGAALLRPNGWILVPVGGVYGVFRTRESRWLRWGAATVAVLAFLAGAAFIGPFRRAIQAENPGLELQRGTVIEGYDGWRLPMPIEPSDFREGWVGSLGYAVRHPWSSARLAVCRIAAELLHARPMYSARHNVVVVLVVLALYPFAVFGCLRLRRAPLARLLGMVIASHLLIVALTFADWDGRFLLYVFPLISLFAACEVAERMRRRLNAFLTGASSDTPELSPLLPATAATTPAADLADSCKDKRDVVRAQSVSEEAVLAYTSYSDDPSPDHARGIFGGANILFCRPSSLALPP